jgi:hypothetical protein
MDAHTKCGGSGPQSFTFTTADGVEHTIHRLQESESAAYSSLGVGAGSSISIAVWMALRHKPDFADRVVAFRMVEHHPAFEGLERAGEGPIVSVEFFELAQ